jgi:diaminopimelate epimerase
MRFTKMQGIGNDFILVSALSANGGGILRAAQENAASLCDRKFGVGADGVIVVSPGTQAALAMRMFNPDGSESEMCGNGIRCFAKFVFDKGISHDTVLPVETGAGLLETRATVNNGVVTAVLVDMGIAHLAPSEIPVLPPNGQTEAMIDYNLKVNGADYRVTCVSMGNPHCVTFVRDTAHVAVAELGPHFEHHECFPRRTNTEWVHIIDRKRIRMRVWERGAGETLACGTGACASAVAAALTGRADRKVTVELAGGNLEIEYAADGHVLMSGPAETVFDGEVDLPIVR